MRGADNGASPIPACAGSGMQAKEQGMSDSIDDYIKGCEKPVQRRLEAVRKLIRATAPDTSETISDGLAERRAARRAKAVGKFV